MFGVRIPRTIGLWGCREPCDSFMVWHSARMCQTDGRTLAENRPRNWSMIGVKLPLVPQRFLSTKYLVTHKVQCSVPAASAKWMKTMVLWVFGMRKERSRTACAAWKRAWWGGFQWPEHCWKPVSADSWVTVDDLLQSSAVWVTDSWLLRPWSDESRQLYMYVAVVPTLTALYLVTLHCTVYSSH